MDEPTNHLEIVAQEALEEALRSYPGTVMPCRMIVLFPALGEEAKVIELHFSRRRAPSRSPVRGKPDRWLTCRRVLQEVESGPPILLVS